MIFLNLKVKKKIKYEIPIILEHAIKESIIESFLTKLFKQIDPSIDVNSISIINRVNLEFPIKHKTKGILVICIINSYPEYLKNILFEFKLINQILRLMILNYDKTKKNNFVYYKVADFSKFLSDAKRILPSNIKGLKYKLQRKLDVAVKIARRLGLVSYFYRESFFIK